MADPDKEAAAAAPAAAAPLAAREDAALDQAAGAVAGREAAEHAKAQTAHSGIDSRVSMLPGIIALILAVLSAVALWYAG